MDASRQFVRYEGFLTHDRVKGGDTVHINRGPLKGLIGVTLKRDDLIRFVVTIDLIGSSVAVDLDPTEFERFDPQSLPLGAREACQLNAAEPFCLVKAFPFCVPP